MNCPSCGDVNYYEGLMGPNCPNTNCSRPGTKKTIVKNKTDKETTVPHISLHKIYDSLGLDLSLHEKDLNGKTFLDYRMCNSRLTLNISAEKAAAEYINIQIKVSSSLEDVLEFAFNVIENVDCDKATPEEIKNLIKEISAI